jgi:hypothetical protein
MRHCHLAGDKVRDSRRPPKSCRGTDLGDHRGRVGLRFPEQSRCRPAANRRNTFSRSELRCPAGVQETEQCLQGEAKTQHRDAMMPHVARGSSFANARGTTWRGTFLMRCCQSRKVEPACALRQNARQDASPWSNRLLSAVGANRFNRQCRGRFASWWKLSSWKSAAWPNP